MDWTSRLNQSNTTLSVASSSTGMYTDGIVRNSKFDALKLEVHKNVIAEYNDRFLDMDLENNNSEETKSLILGVIHRLIGLSDQTLTRAEETRLAQEILDDVLGLGPLEPLLKDDTVSEIMVNSPKQIYVERRGRLELTNSFFRDDAHVLSVINRIVSPIGRRCDESTPMVDARLLDGSRVNAVIPPIALKGPSLTIRKFSKNHIKVSDLISFGSTSPKMAEFLDAAVRGRCNIVVAGGTGSGKTTLLNVLSSFIPFDERIVTIEDAAEVQLHQDHVVTLEGRPSNVEGKGVVSIRDLVRNSLRMRPDRIVIGEVRSGETLDMLQAMNTGHDGSLTTIHANSTRDVISRIETLVMMAGMDLPSKAIREQIASAIDLVVYQSRLRDGSRKITSVAEVVGMEGDIVTMNEIFTFQQIGVSESGNIEGEFMATGVRPKLISKIKDNGVACKEEWFINTKKEGFRQ